jgi:hypothetical protein
MNTVTNNDKLKMLVKSRGLTQTAALDIFNQGLGVRGIKESTWKGYFCNPESTRYRSFNDDLMGHAEKVFNE